MLVRRCGPRGQSWVMDVRTGHGGDRSPTIWVFSCLVSLGIGSNSLCGPFDFCFVTISGVGDASVTGTLGIVQDLAGAGILDDVSGVVVAGQLFAENNNDVGVIGEYGAAFFRMRFSGRGLLGSWFLDRGILDASIFQRKCKYILAAARASDIAW